MGVFAQRFFGAFGERGRGEKQGSESFFFPCLARPGEEEDPHCRSKQHRLGLFIYLFLKQWMKRRRFTQNAPFHLKGNDGKIVPKSTLVLNL